MSCSGGSVPALHFQRGPNAFCGKAYGCIPKSLIEAVDDLHRFFLTALLFLIGAEQVGLVVALREESSHDDADLLWCQPGRKILRNASLALAESSGVNAVGSSSVTVQLLL